MRNFLLCLLCLAAVACQSKPAEEPILGPYVESLEPGPELSDTSRPRGEIRDVFHAHLDEINDCYEQTARGKKYSVGKIVMAVDIDSAGVVSAVGIVSSTLKPANKALENCMSAAIARFAFPKSAVVTRAVTFPYTFTGLGRSK